MSTGFGSRRVPFSVLASLCGTFASLDSHTQQTKSKNGGETCSPVSGNAHSRQIYECKEKKGKENQTRSQQRIPQAAAEDKRQNLYNHLVLSIANLCVQASANQERAVGGGGCK